MTDHPTAPLDRGLLRNPYFLALWAAQLLSQTAANALTFALIVLVFEETHANTASAFLILLAIIPAILFGTLAGVMVDRADRKFVLVTTNVARGVAVALLLILRRDVTAAYIVNFLVAAVTVFFVPAEAATIPKIVRKQSLLAANSLFSVTFNGSFLLGFSIVAPLAIAIGSFEFLFSLLTTMYIVAAILCSLLPKAEPLQRLLGVDVAGQAVEQTRQDLREAVAYLRSHTGLVWVLVYFALTFMLIAVAGALAPGFVTETLERPAKDVYVLSLSAGLGIALGLLLLNTIGGRIPRARAIHWGLATTGVALLALSAARPALRIVRSTLANGDPQPYFLGLVVAAALVFGAAYAFITVPSITLLQEELQDDMRGRVFGVLNTLIAVVSLAPLLVVGSIADQFGVGPVFFGAGIAVLGVWAAGRDAHLPQRARAERDATIADA